MGKNNGGSGELMEEERQKRGIERRKRIRYR
jgi:hypothetical protein